MYARAPYCVPVAGADALALALAAAQ